MKAESAEAPAGECDASATGHETLLVMEALNFQLGEVLFEALQALEPREPGLVASYNAWLAEVDKLPIDDRALALLQLTQLLETRQALAARVAGAVAPEGGPRSSFGTLLVAYLERDALTIPPAKLLSVCDPSNFRKRV